MAFVAVCLTKTENYQKLIEEEVQKGLIVLGEQKWNQVNIRTISMFETVIIHSGFKKYFLDKVKRDTNDEFPLADKTNRLRGFGERIVNNLQILLYQSLHRLNYFLEWLWLFIPFVITQLISGIYHWKISAYSFGNGTKAKQMIFGKTIKFTFWIVIIYFLLPGVFIDIMPYLPVFTIFLFGALLKRQVIHYQKVI